jgi:hypothetical protein
MNPQENEQTELLREILKWTKFTGMKEVKEILNSALETPQKKLVYQLSDGDVGSVEICKVSGIASPDTITRYWKSWTKLGLGENLAVKGGKRFKRAFDLEDFGIEVPYPEKENIKEVVIPDASAKEETTEQKTETKQ